MLEEQSWLSFLRLLEPDTTGDRIIRAYECLLQLYAVEGKRADHGRYAEFQTWHCALSLAIGTAPWSEVNFVEAVRKLIANSVTPEQLIFIRDRILDGGSNLDIPAVYIFRAQVARTLNEPEREAEAFEGYIRSGRIRGVEPRKLRLALEHLAQLLERYAPGKPQSDASVHEKILLRFASLQKTTVDAALVYAGIASTWNPERLQSEIAALLERKNAASVLGLLTAVDNLSLVKVVTTLDSKTLDAIQSVDLADARDYLSRVGTEPFQAMPLLASRLAEQLLSDWNACEADLILGVELCARAVQAGLPPKLIAKLMSSMVRREAHRPSVVLRALRAYGPMGKKISAGVYLELRPLRDADWMEWFLTFPSTGLVLRNRSVAETILADFIEHGSMSLSEDAEAFVWTQIEVLERELSEATTAVE